MTRAGVLSIAMADGIIACPHQGRHRLRASGTMICEFWKGRDRFAGERVPRHDFSQTLAHVIEPNGGPSVELATLEDVARFIRFCQPWRQTPFEICGRVPDHLHTKRCFAN